MFLEQDHDLCSFFVNSCYVCTNTDYFWFSFCVTLVNLGLKYCYYNMLCYILHLSIFKILDKCFYLNELVLNIVLTPSVGLHIYVCIIQKSQCKDLFIFDGGLINLLLFHNVIGISSISLKNVFDKEPRIKVIKVKKIN